MLSHKGTQNIETKRLVLRQFQIEDAQPMFKNWANDPNVTRFMTWEPHGQIENTIELLKGWVADYAKPSVYLWVILDKANREPVGSIGVVDSSEKDMWCEVGYCLSQSLWGQGLTTEALRGVIDFLFREVGFNRIQAKHYAENPASGKVMTKSGMQYEGTLRKLMFKLNYGFYDCLVYSILRQTWEEDLPLA